MKIPISKGPPIITKLHTQPSAISQSIDRLPAKDRARQPQRSQGANRNAKWLFPEMPWHRQRRFPALDRREYPGRLQLVETLCPSPSQTPTTLGLSRTVPSGSAISLGGSIASSRKAKWSYGFS